MKLGGKVMVDTAGMRFLIDEHGRRDVTLKGARAGAKVLERAAKSEAPRRKGSGALRLAQGVKAAKGRKGTTTAYAVQGSKKRVEKMVTLPGRKKPTRVVPAYYDHLVQGGTRPHSVAKGQRLGRGVRMSKRGRIYGAAVTQTNQAGRKKHPGAKPNPYRQRAWNSVQDQAAAAALQAMAAEEQKLLAKAAAKSAAKLQGYGAMGGLRGR